MKPLLVNTYDTLGGAAIASFRLLQGLNRNGVPARMLVQEKLGEDPNVITYPAGRFRKAGYGFRSLIDQQPLRSLYPRRRPVPYSLNWLPGPCGRAVRQLAPDIVHLHWINAGFLNMSSLGSIKPPVVWTLHDMWPFTGVCHYSGGCTNFLKECGTCPLLGSTRDSDLSRWTWRRKQRALLKLDLTIVPPSRWLADQARASRLLGHLPVHVIPNGVDLDLFRPLPKALVRGMLGIDAEKNVLLFGGAYPLTDRRKGAIFLSQALQRIQETDPGAPLEILVFGTAVPREDLPFHFETRYLGVIRDERLMAQVYAAADLYVTPPTEENLANTVMEALACGTPVVAFDVGGMPDMIVHGENGYLARASDTADLAKGICWALDREDRLSGLSQAARDTAVRKFDILKNAKRYQMLFEELVRERKLRSPGRGTADHERETESIRRHPDLQPGSLSARLP